MRTQSSAVNDSAEVEVDGRGSTLAPAVTRAAAILDALAEDGAAPLALSDLARRLGLPKSSVANICSALLDAGLIRRAGAGFGLGRRLAELGGSYLATVDEVQEFYDLADRLPVASEETTQLALLDGLDVTYLARHDGRQPIRLASEIGRRLPASCTALGKAALASLEPADLTDRLRGVEVLPALTSKSHRRVADLLDDLDEVRRRGYAIDDEETAEGVICLGVAIPRPRSGDEPHGVSVTLLKVRAEPGRVEALVADLRRLARQLANPLIAAGTDGRDGRDAR
ncbi:MAG: IclR family transcriptional regulator [Chloroflexota bacterium]